MKTVFDVQQLLKKFHTFIYTGDRVGDLELMEMEVDDLHKLEFISNEEYIQAKFILKKEKSKLT
ncbi:YqgQ family protein [Oceanobacillus sp. Castelsardo]|uniref:YqgQ family protein n=1 Tax=Oceanobacillus sp. Castelsardo TaxID=1851204 RepID=UPI00083978EC|nr:YqgQ family protein [Oceanobacillus sp. Castelsardo]